MLKIAIVGRPNVGKSTLFNRLAGKRLAIVDSAPGVTRDRRSAFGRLGDLDLELIDTAGLEHAVDDSLPARMRRQSERAVDEAQVVIFLIDGRAGVLADDDHFAQRLRRSGKPVILVANKCEGRAGAGAELDAYRLGLGEPVAISAAHGEGLADLYAAVAAAAARPAQTPCSGEERAAAPPIRIAVTGRPNAGKSTLVNALIGEDRMITGPEPGITRDSVSVDWTFEDRRFRLVDTAGLRRKARVEEGLERLSVADALRAINFAEIVLLVMDATHPLETQDLQIADLVAREGRGLVFVLAKWDLVDDPQSRLTEVTAMAQRQLPQVRGAPIVALSAETGAGMSRLIPAVLLAHRDWSARIKTRDLNDWLRLAMVRHPPPAVAGKRPKPKYMVQTKGRPPTFVLLATRAAALSDVYRRYLINSLRESFDLAGAPIRLTVRAPANRYAEKKRTTVRRRRPAGQRRPTR